MTLPSEVEETIKVSLAHSAFEGYLRTEVTRCTIVIREARSKVE